jgi:ubiquinone/menaquinone biosynthesis C-methylase UbiE
MTDKIILGSLYRGRKASGYDAKREGAPKWKRENELVKEMLGARPRGYLLDMPVGTGRFLELYRQHAKLRVRGVDSSVDMLHHADKKSSGWSWSTHNLMLTQGDAVKLDCKNSSFDFVVCVRLLHLVTEPVMRKIVRELVRVSRGRIILTVQLGTAYRLTKDVATHDEVKFRALLKSLGLKTVRDVTITTAGWHVMSLVYSAPATR